MSIRGNIVKRSAAAALVGCMAATLGGCSVPHELVASASSAPQIAPVTPVQRDLIYLPPPPQPVPIAVYSFTDQTGQLKPSENIQSLSRAVTQGGTSVLIKALRDAGNGNWFTVVERERLDNLLKERQIIREMRQRYLGEAETPSSVLPSLLFAGILLEGGIIGYDSNTQTGGIGARFLGIGGDMQYRQNTVTVYLRAISVKTGEVLGNVVTSKTVASVALNTNVFKFVEFDELLEGEAGVSANEPIQIATQAAIEKAVYALIMEGAQPGGRQLWSFADAAAGQTYLNHYKEEKERAIAAAFRRTGPYYTDPIDDPKKTARAKAAKPQARASGNRQAASAKVAANNNQNSAGQPTAR
ncbi:MULTISPECIES: CsgG/HfaB family protein [unclassified Sphingobium]|uniref:CsgG/HfaB family protein n=1 Tax=unclassified Sphingobium TaxID=2611147 RepID=UPI001F317917|nr:MULTISPECIES: CsgG/HfaB family protein [unclassified Sphingobium]